MGYIATFFKCVTFTVSNLMNECQGSFIDSKPIRFLTNVRLHSQHFAYHWSLGFDLTGQTLRYKKL